VYDKKHNRFIVFGGLTSGNEVEVCVNDTYQLVIENNASFTFNEAVSPGRLGYDCRKKGRSFSDTGEGGTSGSSSSSGPMAVWKRLHCTGSLPSPRWCHSGVLQEEYMIVFGGWSYERTVGVGTGSKFFNDVHILNITTLVWTKIMTTGSPPRARCQCACFLFENKIDDLTDEKGSEEEKNNMIEKIKNKNQYRTEDIPMRRSMGNDKIVQSSTSMSMEGKSTSTSTTASNTASTKTSTPLSVETDRSLSPRSKSKSSSPLESMLNDAEELISESSIKSQLSTAASNSEHNCEDENIDIDELSIVCNLSHQTHEDIRKAECTVSRSIQKEKRNHCRETSLRETLDQILESAIGSNEGFEDGEVCQRVEGEVVIGEVERGRAVECSKSSCQRVYGNPSSGSSNCSINAKCSSSSSGCSFDAGIEVENEVEQVAPSKGYMIIFGGSCHNQEVSMRTWIHL
jgi:Kelch motif